MTENQNEKNPFIEAMEQDKSEASVVNGCGQKYETNPTAEGMVNTVAVLTLLIGIIGSVVLLGVAVGQLDSYHTETIGWILLGVAAVVLIAGVIGWAFLRVFVNISRNLFNIREEIKDLKK